MKKEGTIGAAAFLAIAAVLGLSLQPGARQEGNLSGAQTSATRRPGSTSKTHLTPEVKPGCGSLEGELQDFLDIQGPIAPAECYESESNRSKDPSEKTSQLNR